MRLCMLSIISGIFLMGSLVAKVDSNSMPGSKNGYVLPTCPYTVKKCHKVSSGVDTQGQTVYKTRAGCRVALKDFVCSQ